MPAHADPAELRALALDAASGRLIEGATQVVPGEGNPAGGLVLVGEAPGADEDRQGRPFVGRSGKLLETMLEAAGLVRADAWVTNVVKCRPVAFEGGRARNRPPTPAEVKAWLPVLEAELKRLAPRVVVGLGAVAGKALVDAKFRITQERGQWRETRLVGAPVIVTWHPAFILRQAGSAYEERLAEAVADFATARARLAP